tara:strand:- start:559 stop:1071 length:513 start_codon:yes stop_codon:yes gene_type:complete
MQINKIELKNISHYERGSEETPCYNATVYVNGKKTIEVGNDGHGGCDRQQGIGEYNYNHIEEVNKWCIKTFGKKSFTYTSDGGEKECFYDFDLEQFCHDELYKWLDSKDLKKDMSKKYLFVEDKKLYGYPRKNKDQDLSFKTFFFEKHPSAECLNFLPFDDAIKLFKESA